MTRVEKYRRYREEIANMKFESSSSRKTISEKIERIRGGNESSKLNYEQVLNVFGTYDSDAKINKTRHFRLKKSQVIYWSIASVVILGLLIAIIVVACNMWGNLIWEKL